MIRDLEKSPKRRSRANAKWVVVAAAARDEGHYRTFPTSRATHKFGRRNRSCCCCSSWCRWCAELFQTIISCRLCYVAIKTYTVFCQQLCTATSTVLLRLLLLLHLPQPPPVAPSAEREAAQELATRSLRFVLVLHSHTAAAAQSDRASEPASQPTKHTPSTERQQQQEDEDDEEGAWEANKDQNQMRPHYLSSPNVVIWCHVLAAPHPPLTLLGCNETVIIF